MGGITVNFKEIQIIGEYTENIKKVENVEETDEFIIDMAH